MGSTRSRSVLFFRPSRVIFIDRDPSALYNYFIASRSIVIELCGSEDSSIRMTTS